MNEVQVSAAKKAVVAVLGAICLILLFRMSPMLAIMLVFLGGVGFGTYTFYMDMEKQRISEEEHKRYMEKIRKEHEEALDKIRR